MDIKKLQEIIDNSKLSPEAKDLILDLIPEIDKPGVQEEILKTIDYEVKMYGLAADEFEEVSEQLQSAEKKMDAADVMEDEQLIELSQKYEEKMAVAEDEMKQATEYKDKLVDALAPSTDTQAQTISKQATPVVTEDITPVGSPVSAAALTEVPAQSNPGYGGQQYNSTTAVPTPTTTPTPEPLPAVPVMGE